MSQQLSDNEGFFEPPTACDIIVPGDREAQTALQPLIRHWELSTLDCMTIRDLLKYGGCQGDLSLIAVLIAMFAGLQKGNLCLDLDRITDPDLWTAQEGEAIQRLCDTFAANLAAGQYRGLITDSSDVYLPLIVDRSSGRHLLYFQKYHVHEQRLKTRMETLLNAATAWPIPEQGMEDRLNDIYSPDRAIRVGSDQTPIARDVHQGAAIRLALASQFAIVSGGPGTGKTSLMVNILRCLVHEGVDARLIILGAPTGRAAQRMTETIQTNIATIQKPTAEDIALGELRGSTLHKILGYRSRKHNFHFNAANPLRAAVIIVDEVSMIDVVMLDKFLQAVDTSRTKLIFLGDKHQLPSVEAGAVFAEMIPDDERATRFQNHFVILDKVYRSGTRILALATKVNQGTPPQLNSVPFYQALDQEPDNWSFVEAQGFEQWRSDIHHWAHAHYRFSDDAGGEGYEALIHQAAFMSAGDLNAGETGRRLLQRIFTIIEQARILSVQRNGLYGCNHTNDLIAAHLIGHLDPMVAGTAGGFNGAMIIITRNDYGKELFNGDVGVIINNPGGTRHAYFHRSGAFISYPVTMLPDWELAFAMTVHKSQGSEFDDVLLVLPDDEQHRLLTREIVYTGITRAKKTVILYGTKKGFATALQRKIQRVSGLKW